MYIYIDVSIIKQHKAPRYKNLLILLKNQSFTYILKKKSRENKYEKITKMCETFDVSLLNDEKLFLIIHILRITKIVEEYDISARAYFFPSSFHIINLHLTLTGARSVNCDVDVRTDR